MTSVTRVPETGAMAVDDLGVEDAWATMRRCGAWPLIRASVARFRYGDGFSHSRALGLQLCLAVVPFLIAFGSPAPTSPRRSRRSTASTTTSSRDSRCRRRPR